MGWCFETRDLRSHVHRFPRQLDAYCSLYFLRQTLQKSLPSVRRYTVTPYLVPCHLVPSCTNIHRRPCDFVGYCTVSISAPPELVGADHLHRSVGESQKYQGEQVVQGETLHFSHVSLLLLSSHVPLISRLDRRPPAVHAHNLTPTFDLCCQASALQTC